MLIFSHTVALPYCVGLFFLMLGFFPSWPLLIVYVFYAYFYDQSVATGDITLRRSQFIRRLPLFRLYCDYFPIRIHRETILEPTFPDHLREPSSTLETWIARIFHMKAAIEVSLRNGKIVKSTSSNESETTKGALNEDITTIPQQIQPGEIEKKEESNNEITNLGPRYVFGYHPHGIVGLGAFGAIGTEGAGWENLFPGIPVSLLTLETNFHLPFYREYLLSLGIASVSRKSCTALLKHNQSICIVVGGAQEALLSVPGSIELILKKRKGFVKLAMSTPGGRTNLVPILSFGENDLYEQIKGDESSLLYKTQTLIKKFFGFTLPLMHARGIFNYDFGLMPYRRPVNLVVGNPIPVPFIEHPTEAEVNIYHKKYTEELQRLWDTYKGKYVIDYNGVGTDNITFNIVE
ncbi:diacylglycerol acyltransferase-domain-containing protein [Dipodascopsis uninucleata]